LTKAVVSLSTKSPSSAYRFVGDVQAKGLLLAEGLGRLTHRHIGRSSSHGELLSCLGNLA